LQSTINNLAGDNDLHVRELAFAARQYASANPSDPKDYDGHYNHGLVLQELSGKLPPGSTDQVNFLKEVGCD
jgi:hypothetical protein